MEDDSPERASSPQKPGRGRPIRSCSRMQQRPPHCFEQIRLDTGNRCGAVAETALAALSPVGEAFVNAACRRPVHRENDRHGENGHPMPAFDPATRLGVPYFLKVATTLTVHP